MDRVTDPAAINEMLEVEHHFLPSLYAKKMQLKAGTSIGKHVHTYDHVSVLAKGKVRVSFAKPNTGHRGRIVLTAPASMPMMAGFEHEVEAIEDSLWYCIHATDETDPDKIDDALTSAGKD